VRYGEDIGMEVRQLPSLGQRSKVEGQRSEVEGQGPEVSSSMVRRLLAEGAVKEAAECLGCPYSITGKVVKGEHIGTGLGYPTANLQPNDPRKMIPAPGVYAVSVTVEGQRSKVKGQRTKDKGQRSKDIYMGMMNIGTRPTFGVHPQTLEVHILDYEGDLYGKEITVSFIKRLREERCFDNKEELKTQLEEDRRRVEELRIEN
jgi:riboflavin kinase/FMN adenylyltransferase